MTDAHAAPFTHPVRIYWEDTDAGGIVGFTAVLSPVSNGSFITATATDDAHDVQVYNCRDLLEGVVVQRQHRGAEVLDVVEEDPLMR